MHSKIQYLVKRAEEFSQRKEKKDIRPEWMAQFIQETADLFEPATDAARVGFDCRYEMGRWLVFFYLGEAEIFGGMHDGMRERIAFDFDIKELVNQFDVVDAMHFQSLPDNVELQNPENCTAVEIAGIMNRDDKSHPVSISILSHPPQAAGPGIRVLPNGEIESL